MSLTSDLALSSTSEHLVMLGQSCCGPHSVSFAVGLLRSPGIRHVVGAALVPRHAHDLIGLPKASLVWHSCRTTGPRRYGHLCAAQATAVDARADAILQFWLGHDYRDQAPTYVPQHLRKMWFAGSADTDNEVRERFADTMAAAAAGRLDWQRGYEALASVILQDQLTRNMYRGTPQMYSLDDQALRLAKDLLASGEAAQFVPPHRTWLMMPFMHSERLEDQQAGEQHHRQLLDECKRLPGGGEPVTALVADSLRFAMLHREVIQRWGRFPHRNALLGRETTPEEAAGMAEGTIPAF